MHENRGGIRRRDVWCGLLCGKINKREFVIVKNNVTGEEDAANAEVHASVSLVLEGVAKWDEVRCGSWCQFVWGEVREFG